MNEDYKELAMGIVFVFFSLVGLTIGVLYGKTSADYLITTKCIKPEIIIHSSYGKSDTTYIYRKPNQ